MGKSKVVVKEDEAIPKETTYIVYNRRWLVLAATAIPSFAASALWITYAPIISFVSVYYNKTQSEINQLATLGFLIGIPVSLWIVFTRSCSLSPSASMRFINGFFRYTTLPSSVSSTWYMGLSP